MIKKYYVVRGLLYNKKEARTVWQSYQLVSSGDVLCCIKRYWISSRGMGGDRRNM